MEGTPFNVVFLAGGIGTRMKSAIPKQYLQVLHQPLALYSFEIFASLPEVQHMVVVCEPYYEELFQKHVRSKKLDLQFARPGERRQDSVFNGIQNLPDQVLVCIHDAARPLIESEGIRRVVQAADKWEAAALGVKVRSTIKVCDGAQMVVNTPSRTHLWEIQTPQVIRLSLLKKGFDFAQEHQLTVTDDVSLVELLGHAVKIVEGSYSNIKVTLPEDLLLIEQLLERHAML